MATRAPFPRLAHYMSDIIFSKMAFCNCRQVWRVLAKVLGECRRVWRVLAILLGKCWRKRTWKNRLFYVQITSFICIKQYSLQFAKFYKMHQTCLYVNTNFCHTCQIWLARVPIFSHTCQTGLARVTTSTQNLLFGACASILCLVGLQILRFVTIRGRVTL